MRQPRLRGFYCLVAVLIASANTISGSEDANLYLSYAALDDAAQDNGQQHSAQEDDFNLYDAMTGGTMPEIEGNLYDLMMQGTVDPGSNDRKADQDLVLNEAEELSEGIEKLYADQSLALADQAAQLDKAHQKEIAKIQAKHSQELKQEQQKLATQLNEMKLRIRKLKGQHELDIVALLDQVQEQQAELFKNQGACDKQNQLLVKKLKAATSASKTAQKFTTPALPSMQQPAKVKALQVQPEQTNLSIIEQTNLSIIEQTNLSIIEQTNLSIIEQTNLSIIEQNAQPVTMCKDDHHVIGNAASEWVIPVESVVFNSKISENDTARLLPHVLVELPPAGQMEEQQKVSEKSKEARKAAAGETVDATAVTGAAKTKAKETVAAAAVAAAAKKEAEEKAAAVAAAAAAAAKEAEEKAAAAAVAAAAAAAKEAEEKAAAATKIAAEAKAAAAAATDRKEAEEKEAEKQAAAAAVADGRVNQNQKVVVAAASEEEGEGDIELWI
jgi:hypothetical protein